MKMISLQALIEGRDIKEVVVSPSELQTHRFPTDGEEFETKKDWIVKGVHRFEGDTLYCEQLEEGISVEILRPTHVNGVALEHTSQEVEDAVNLEVSAIVFNRKDLAMAGREVRIKDIPNWIKATIESYTKNHPEQIVVPEDFAVIEIDWANKHFDLKAIEQKP